MVVLACEGACEVYLMQQLLDNDCLIFNKKEILDRRPIHMRQPKEISALIDTLSVNEKIVFYRIGDTQKEDFSLSCFWARKENISVYKVCTKPEIEILIIINEHLHEEYMKTKSKVSPKQFVKTHIKDYVSFNDYIQNHDMIWSIKEYKRIKRNDKNELYIDDLLK